MRQSGAGPQRAWPARGLSLALVLLACACDSASATPASGPLRIVLGDSPQRGPSDAWVTIVEFADFECPYSAAEQGALRTLLADLPSDVRVVYKHFPLSPSPHPHALAAAIAAECVRQQRPAPDPAFWTLHDLLFRYQADLTVPALFSAAAQVRGLSGRAWRACIGTQPPLDRVRADQAQGMAAGVERTPTFAINGVRVVGAVSYSVLRAQVEAALATARASGIPRMQYYQEAVLDR